MSRRLVATPMIPLMPKREEALELRYAGITMRPLRCCNHRVPIASEENSANKLTSSTCYYRHDYHAL